MTFPNEFVEFCRLLSEMDPGVLAGENNSMALSGLKNTWDLIPGSEESSTTSDKLHRAEKLTWEPPILSFTLERHGGTVNGSSRAELHHWEIDTSNFRAKISKRGSRQLEPTAPRFYAKACAEKVANLILKGENHEYLTWKTEHEWVIINIGKVIPESFPRTTSGRRKRFRDELGKIMVSKGWIRRDHGNKIGFEKK
ncbi:hypothetical protein G8764_16715 [Pseudomaricurvus alcaniphilus]|uniref:hypothetical protein n=1 Tax=Pseudomaricurvus alcaniphilus TaxID=1166482 RepID=UPI00140C9AD9|nr:hypothetical protein [Pseudomaricurvus alcaniphilus]NHN38953.1 hypothetical protein [Pseudomaricurvus alcaniphilus]